MLRIATYVLSFVIVTPCWVLAGQYNSARSIGEPGPAWSNLPGTDDKMHSLSDLKDRDVLVLAFTCNSCPYAIDYEDRLNNLAKKYSQSDSKVGVVAINVNKIAADLLPAMKVRAKEKGFRFSYLFDESQQIAKAYGATRTPEFFVLNKARQIVYMGTMDDNYKESEVKVRYIELAVAAALAGEKAAPAETPPVGCLIRFARERK